MSRGVGVTLVTVAELGESDAIELDGATEGGVPTTDRPETRRQRLRRELTAEILEIARAQLESEGPGGVSWRGIAREVGMNPASLYTYFSSLDDLFTALILQSYQGLAAAVSDAAKPVGRRSAQARLVAGAKAYRSWALEHPAQFNLIFTDQLPGYAAPAGGPTLAAELAVFRPLVAAMADAAGRPLSVDSFADLSADDRQRVIGMYASMHGLVSLEVNHHLPPGPECESLMIGELKAALARL